MLPLLLAAHGSTFRPPVDTLRGKTAIIVATDGSEHRGRPKVIAFGTATIRRVVLRNDTVPRRVWLPDEIRSMTFQTPYMARDGGTETAIFRPGVYRSGANALFQLLNVGFDGTYEVFADPAGRLVTSNRDNSAGPMKSYLVRAHGQTNMLLVKKANYAKKWGQLFGGCPAMAVPETFQWAAFASEVARHEALCPPGR